MRTSRHVGVCLLAASLLLVCGRLSAVPAAAEGLAEQAVEPLAAVLEEARARDMTAWMVSIRRKLHRMPELMYSEHATSQLVRTELDALAIPYRYPVAETGVVATIGDDTAGGCIGLRADMDALPIQEASGVEYASEVEGHMHACGHDGHTAMLLGAARLLKAREPGLAGCVKLIFQPAEEGGGGAARLLKENALAGVSAIFGIHVWPTANSGTVLTRPGMIMAASTRFTARILGAGGHAAQPHLLRDPITAGAQAVVSLQQLVARELSPTDAGVVSVSRFNTAEPSRAHMVATLLNRAAPCGLRLQATALSTSSQTRWSFKGTIRASTNEAFRHLIERTEEVIKGVAAAHRCTASLNWSAVPYDALVNDAAMARLTLSAAARMMGSGAVLELEAPSMAAEDFGFLAGAVPGCFAFLGTGQQQRSAPTVGLHRPAFRLDESSVCPIQGRGCTPNGWPLEYLAGGRRRTPRRTVLACNADSRASGPGRCLRLARRLRRR
eukprot:jgi/Tetstr1/460799/TSEL_000555.t1